MITAEIAEHEDGSVRLKAVVEKWTQLTADLTEVCAPFPSAAPTHRYVHRVNAIGGHGIGVGRII